MFSHKIKNPNWAPLFVCSIVNTLLGRYSIIDQRLCNLSSGSCNTNRYHSLRKHYVFHTGIRTLKINHFTCAEKSTEEIDTLTYESICEETLDSLCEFFEDTVESSPLLKAADVSLGDGVLTVNLGKFGTYVVNRQSPNKQLWLSSPTSGPKRFDFIKSRNGWVYRHDNQTLHSLLQQEISAITKTSVDLSNCAYCGELK